MIRGPRRSTLFPYTTLFRSQEKQHWPKTLPEQVKAVRSALAQQPAAVTPAELARNWTRARAERVEELLRRSEEHTSELQSRQYLVCRLLLEKKNPPSSVSLS